MLKLVKTGLTKHVDLAKGLMLTKILHDETEAQILANEDDPIWTAIKLVPSLVDNTIGEDSLLSFTETPLGQVYNDTVGGRAVLAVPAARHVRLKADKMHEGT